VLVLLTDGQANVSRDGTRGRAPAREDAADAARRVRQSGVRTLLLDISPRPSRPAADLAAAMGGTHVPLPFADAQAVSTIVRAHVDAGAELASAG
jgi:magnesium chelatase subunit D